MQRGIYSIDSERGLSDTELNSPIQTEFKKDVIPTSTEAKEKANAGDKDKDKEHAGIERSPSRTSFKAVALVTRMGTAAEVKKKKLKAKSEIPMDSLETETDSELDETAADSGYADAKNIAPVLDALKGTVKRRKSIKDMAEKTTTAVFSTAKKLYESKQSTFKRTGGRLNSAGTQTTPASSTLNIPGLAETPEPDIDSLYEHHTEKSLFVYLVNEGRKNCIGKVVLPEGDRNLTLNDLRTQLLNSEEGTVRHILRNNRSFRFVTETYRFVAQNEQAVNVDDIYTNQGVFVKLEGASVPLDLRMPSRASDGPSAASMRSRRGGSGRRIRRTGHHQLKSDDSTDTLDAKLSRSPYPHPSSRMRHLDSGDELTADGYKHYSAFNIRGIVFQYFFGFFD